MSALRVTQAALWLLAALFLGLTVLPFLDALPVGDLLPVQRQARPAAPPTLADLDLSPIESFAETLNRPLFTATRRPPSPLERLQGPRAAPTPAAAKGERVILGKYVLRGVIVTPEQKLLLLKQLATGKSMRLKEGDALDDWRIASITADLLVLDKDGAQQKVPLKGGQ
jgi:general secretion pathway protein N